MSVQTTTSVATLPKVNLLPPEIGERKKLQLVQAGAVAAVVLAAGIVGYMYHSGQSGVSTAKHDAATATTQNATLVRQLATYSDVRKTASELAAAQAMQQQVFSTRITWSHYLEDFSLILPKSTWLTNVNFTESLLPASIANASQATDPVGTVSWQGYAMKWNDLADWLDSLAPEQGVGSVYFSKAQEAYLPNTTTKVINFTANAEITSKAVTGECAAGGC